MSKHLSLWNTFGRLLLKQNTTLTISVFEVPVLSHRGQKLWETSLKKHIFNKWPGNQVKWISLKAAIDVLGKSFLKTQSHFRSKEDVKMQIRKLYLWPSSLKGSCEGIYLKKFKRLASCNITKFSKATNFYIFC